MKCGYCKEDFNSVKNKTGVSGELVEKLWDIKEYSNGIIDETHSERIDRLAKRIAKWADDILKELIFNSGESK